MAKTRASIVTPYLDNKKEWPEEDQKHWSKQHHTAKRIYERLKEEHGFTRSHDSVQKFVQKLRKDVQAFHTAFRSVLLNFSGFCALSITSHIVVTLSPSS